MARGMILETAEVNTLATARWFHASPIRFRELGKKSCVSWLSRLYSREIGLDNVHAWAKGVESNDLEMKRIIWQALSAIMWKLIHSFRRE